MSYTQAQTVLEKVVDLFGSKELAKTTAHAFINAPGKPSGKWSLLNRIVMILSDTEDARGFRQWQKVGRNVQRGKKAFYILAPKMIKSKKTNSETGEVKDEYYLGGFTNIPVFRYEDTEGKDLEVYKPATVPPLSPFQTFPLSPIE